MADTAMQYRTVLYDPNKPMAERPVQAFHCHEKNARDWAEAVLKSSGAGSQVWLYEMTEVLKGTWHYPQKEDTPRKLEDVPLPVVMPTTTSPDCVVEVDYKAED